MTDREDTVGIRDAIAVYWAHLLTDNPDDNGCQHCPHPQHPDEYCREPTDDDLCQCWQPEEAA